MFPVTDEDVITVDHAGKQVEFPVKSILDRSGMKFIDPRADGFARYRFEPLWFHRLLVHMHNEQRGTGQIALSGIAGEK